MRKYIFFLLALTLASTGLQANFIDCYRSYIGITGGAAVFGRESRATAPGRLHFSHLGGTEGLVGAVFGAQAYFCRDIFGALQFNTLYNTTNRVIRNDVNVAHDRRHGVAIRNHFQWGFDGRIGWRICGYTNPYFLAGFESARWQLRLFNDSPHITEGIPAFSRVIRRRTLVAPKVGFGVTFPLSCCIAFNFEYSYTWFGKVSKSLFDSATGVTWNHRIRIDQNSILFGLNYLF
jgi:opacity protein-like surface antigen